MSSKRRIRRNACHGKVRHKTREGAFIAASLMNKKNRHVLAIGDRKVSPYHCRFCGNFHIGHAGAER